MAPGAIQGLFAAHRIGTREPKAPWLTRLTLDKTPITRHKRNISIKATRLELPALQFALQVPNVTFPALLTERSLPERVMHDRILVVWH